MLNSNNREPTAEEILEPHGNTMVKTVARRGISDKTTTPPEVHALFEIALERCDDDAVAIDELRRITKELDTCSLKVRDWLLLQ